MTERKLIVAMILIIFGAMALVMMNQKRPPKRPVDALIGYGCGPDKQTMVAREEDEFPRCNKIIQNHAIPGEM